MKFPAHPGDRAVAALSSAQQASTEPMKYQLDCFRLTRRNCFRISVIIFAAGGPFVMSLVISPWWIELSTAMWCFARENATFRRFSPPLMLIGPTFDRILRKRSIKHTAANVPVSSRFTRIGQRF
jgi:hypothetical protein